MKSTICEWPQKRKPAGTSRWHCGQVGASGAPHCPQKRIPGGFSKWQAEHAVPGVLTALLNQTPGARARP